jgi:hypothetical protein
MRSNGSRDANARHKPAARAVRDLHELRAHHDAYLAHVTDRALLRSRASITDYFTTVAHCTTTFPTTTFSRLSTHRERARKHLEETLLLVNALVTTTFATAFTSTFIQL